MYQPGLDNHLAEIRYAEALEDAARERAELAACIAPPAARPNARRLALALAAATPIAVWIVWTLAAH